MFILTITDALGMTYVEAFREMKDVRKFIPPVWSNLQTPTRMEAVQFGDNCAIAGEYVREVIYV